MENCKLAFAGAAVSSRKNFTGGVALMRPFFIPVHFHSVGDMALPVAGEVH
jgi:hypothetical protein